MKFRTISRLRYLKRARHRHGHGIHSPFLFHLITTVIEEKIGLPEYNYCKKFKYKVLKILESPISERSNEVNSRYNSYSAKKLYRKVELPLRFGKVIFRLIREFKPAAIASFGPSFGTNLILMGMANPGIKVYSLNNESLSDLIARQLCDESATTNINFIDINDSGFVNSGFILINHPDQPELTRFIVNQKLNSFGEDDVLIIRGIHDSEEMESAWFSLISDQKVRGFSRSV